MSNCVDLNLNKLTFQIWYSGLQMFSLEVELKTRKCEDDFSIVIVILQFHICRNRTRTACSLDRIRVGFASIFFEHWETVDGWERKLN